MGEVGLAGRRIGMEEERLGLERRAKLPLIRKLETEEGRLQEIEARKEQPSMFSTPEGAEEHFGPDPDKRWWNKLIEVTDKSKHALDESGNVIGLKIKNKDVPDTLKKVFAKTSPLDLVARSQNLRKLEDSLIKNGAVAGGNTEIDQQLAVTQRTIKNVNDALGEAQKSPAAFIAFKVSQLGPDGIKHLTKIERELVEAFIAKKKGKLPAFSTTEAGVRLKAELEGKKDPFKKTDYNALSKQVGEINKVLLKGVGEDGYPLTPERKAELRLTRNDLKAQMDELKEIKPSKPKKAIQGKKSYGASDQPEGTVARNPKTGERIITQNGKWVLAQE